ncbi:MAG: flavin reductase [Cytophagales bacterium]
MNINHVDIECMDKRYRTQFVNSLSGFKSLFLIGTINKQGDSNLAIFNSVIHIGANPPLLGLISRPDTVERHSFENIKEIKLFTLNSVDKTIYHKAHQTAARYDKSTSEFEAAGLSMQFMGDCQVPFVKESSLKIEMMFRESYDIKSNGTHLIIAEIQNIYLPESCIEMDGYINLENMGILSGSGLDAYHETKLIERLPYAKPKL